MAVRIHMRVHRFSNLQIAGTLREMGELFDMEGVQFKPRAYERAALGVEGLDREATDIYKEGGAKALLKIAGVGAGIAAHMEELFTTGHFSEYERMKKRMPVDIAGLTAVEGVGPKMIRTLYRKLGVKNIRDLERVARKGTIHTIPSPWGKKRQKKRVGAGDAEQNKKNNPETSFVEKTEKGKLFGFFFFFRFFPAPAAGIVC